MRVCAICLWGSRMEWASSGVCKWILVIEHSWCVVLVMFYKNWSVFNKELGVLETNKIIMFIK